MPQAPIHDGYRPVTRDDVSDANTAFLGRRLDGFMQEIRTTLDLHRADIVAIGKQVTAAIGDLPKRMAMVETSVDRCVTEIVKVKRRVAALEKAPKRKPRKKVKRK